MNIFKKIMEVLPDVFSLIEYFTNMSDHEFEAISKTWPAPIKITMAKIRFEAKLEKEFPND